MHKHLLMLTLCIFSTCHSQESELYETSLVSYDLKTCRNFVFSNANSLSESADYMDNPILKEVRVKEVSDPRQLTIVGYLVDPNGKLERHLSVICSAQVKKGEKNAAKSKEISCFSKENNVTKQTTYSKFMSTENLAIFSSVGTPPFSFNKIYELTQEEDGRFIKTQAQNEMRYQKCRAGRKEKP